MARKYSKRRQFRRTPLSQRQTEELQCLEEIKIASLLKKTGNFKRSDFLKMFNEKIRIKLAEII